MRGSFAKCGLTGRNYIGGVAGYGMNVSGCNTLVNLNGSGNCVGTIAGEIDKDGSADGNYFVHETEAGIDGISYAGKAEGMSYEASWRATGSRRSSPALPSRSRPTARRSRRSRSPTAARSMNRRSPTADGGGQLWFLAGA